MNKPQDWDRARYYLAWAKRKGHIITAENMPTKQGLKLSKQDKEMILALAQTDIR